ncbi:aldehyde dehydrogenase (NADP(+)) [Rheinheimera sp. EpRS3]|uniref:aldehyde dehydrogenase (NADP(+)) n=1 Tax=Rheinheimera sp. EpRS3 TaxID=1712383 RepID=UPI00074B2C8A|nr:aldehyde dehydrogenase (NADP(+)) [Rheinheimera sp. EpRS3]KUM53144.1 2,5-dioxovalerate dehydrogenase [Rheinheimera sp. EpRS3]
MRITGKQLINGQWLAGEAGQYQAINPATGQKIAPALSYASKAQVASAVAAAEAAAPLYANTSAAQRAEFLQRCAEEVMALGDELIERVMQETGYPRGRVEGERGRICHQLRLFASSIRTGDYLDIRIDTALPERQPLPRPDIRFMNQPLGPVVVFGASNFPLAFSVAGGDTAAALAAGCPVLVKGHNSHPGSCELVAQALDNAVKACGLPSGVFSLLMGSGREIGSELVVAPAVKAVGFTGSLAGGMALFKLANDRPEPIPVFAEMGSVNPVVFLPQALQQSGAVLAQGYVASLTLGCGQFCVNPGVAVAIAGPELDSFMQSAAEALAKTPAGVMLNDNIADAYNKGVAELAAQPGVSIAGSGAAVTAEQGFYTQAQLFKVAAATFLANPHLQEEVFGHTSVVVVCNDNNQLLQVVSSLKGQLTGTIHCTEPELAGQSKLVQLLRSKVGRLVINNFPTGVEVCDAMMHGGPFPAATDARFTSVGTASIARFIRPICFQNYPQALLPQELQDSNPLQISRLVNGERTTAAVEAAVASVS